MNRAPALPAMGRYALATSDLDDDALEMAVAPFGAPTNESGLGMAELFHDLMTRQPMTVPVNDVATLQQNLKNTGYAPDAEPDGVWSPYWYQAHRRSTRDATELLREGGHWTSASTTKFFEYLGYTVPSKVFQAIAGMAEGIVKSAAEVAANPIEAAEEGGALGLGAAGAVVGGTVGGPVGALVGLGVGGLAGFAADLFGDDEGEEDQSAWDQFWDAMSPYDEFKSGGAKSFVALLDTVMVASGLLKGVKLAIGSKGAVTAAGQEVAGTGVRGAAEALKAGMPYSKVTGGVSAGGMAFPTVEAGVKHGLRGAFTAAQKGTVAPGILARLTSGMVKRPIVGGAAAGFGFEAIPEFLQGDFAEGIKEGLEGAAVGAVLGPVANKLAPQRSKDALLRGLEAAPLRRALTTPAGKMAQSVYTGASASALSGRLFGGLGSGEDVTPIEQAIEDAPDLGTFGHVLDWTLGSIVYPERLLPWRGRELGQAFSSLSSGHAMIPFAENARRTVQNGQTVYLSFREGMRRSRQALGAGPNGFEPSAIPLRMTYGYLQFQIEKVAREAMRGRGFADHWDEAAALATERATVTKRLLKDPNVAQAAFREAVADPWGMQNYLNSFEGRKTSLENFAEHQHAVELLQRQPGVQQAPGAVLPAVRDQYQTRQDFTRFADEYEVKAKTFQDAWKNSSRVVGAPDPHVLSAGRAMDDLIVDMHKRQMIDDTAYNRLRSTNRDGQGNPLYDPAVPKRLREIAKTRAPMNEEMTKVLSDAGLDRYIAIDTSEGMLRYDHVKDMAIQSGADEYTKRQGFFDLLASMTSKPDESMQLGTARYHSIASELDLVTKELGLNETGKQLTNRINKALRTRYDVDAARARGENVSAWGPIVRMEDATGKKHMELFKVDPRDLTPDDLIRGLPDLEDLDDPLEAAHRIKRAVHVGAAFGADAMKFPMHPVQQARALARGLKINGLPGLNDFMRTIDLSPSEMLRQIDRGPAVVQGLAKKGADKNIGGKSPYWYLPNRLHRISMSARYALSPSFDIGRYIEQATLGVYRGEIPIMASTAPRRFIANRPWRSPYRSDMVTGDEAVKDALKFYDEEILGRNAFSTFDELQMRLLHRGIMGFSPRQAEAAQAWYLYQKAAAKGPVKAAEIENIRTAVFEIGRYGTGVSPLAKSVHFIWFPALFQQKMFTHLHDFVLGAPVRNLMIHEGFRKWYSVNSQGESMATQFSEFMEKHIPIADEIAKFNSLSFGLGPGRFFLEGIADQSAAGKVGQALTSFFVPGGSHQPLQEFGGAATGVAGQAVVPDKLKHLFVPVVVTEDTPSEQFMDIVGRLGPAYRDAQNFIFGYESKSGGHVPGAFSEQLTALPVVGEGAAPMWQMSEYLDAKKQMEIEMEGALGTTVQDLGYESFEGFLGSDAGAPFREIMDRYDKELGAQFPSGKEIANRFVNSAELRDQYVYNLSQKPERTEAEDVILAVGEAETMVKMMAEQVNLSQEDALRAVAPIIRKLALSQVKNPQFRQLWAQWFEMSYGPVAAIRLTSGEVQA